TCLLISSWLGHIEIVKALLEKGVPVSTRDNDGRTPLHLAACATSTKIVEELLKHSADPCEWDFENKYTPLHCAAAAGCIATVKFLIMSGANVHTKRSPLYYAVLNNAVDCVETLLHAGASPNNSQAGASVNKADIFGCTPLHIAALNESSRTVMMFLSKGGVVTARTKDGITALSFIVSRTPEVLSQLATRFDQAVSLHYHELGHMDCELRVDFRPLVPLGGRNETDLMLCLVEVGQGRMLKHPLCESFLYLKWKRIRKFFVLNFLFHLIFVAFFTSFVFATYLWNEKQLSAILFWPLVTIICLFASKEIFQISSDIYYYIKRWETWLQWSVIVASSLILIPPARPWQHHVAALGILLAWLELMIVTGYFPIFGLYVQMFTEIFINFFKFLAAHICLIFGFSLGFIVLHDKYKSFTDPLISLFKSVIMTIGELEFEYFFFNESLLEYSGTAHFMFLCFVILVAVILMNQIIGLAVSDIQELRSRAGLEQLVRQAEVIARFENMLFSELLDYTPACKIIQACRENILLLHPPHHCVLRIRLNDPHENRLPRELIQSLYRLAAEKKMRRGIFRGGAPPSQNFAANELNYVRFNRMYRNDGNQ
ncbi:Transient receptor potential channel pyrexia, partial [Camponotus floridanus]